nr:7kDa-protein [Grapevine leafroll-associated virus 13]
MRILWPLTQCNKGRSHSREGCENEVALLVVLLVIITVVGLTIAFHKHICGMIDSNLARKLSRVKP